MNTAPPSPPGLRQFYKTSEGYVDGLLARSPAYFAAFCDLVRQFNGPEGTILEIGAGASQAASRLAADGERVVAMDLSHLFLSRARRLRQKRGGPQPHLVAGDATTLPFTTETFDVVCLHDVIEHINDQDSLWTEVARVVRPGGHIVAVGPNLLSPINPLLMLLRELKTRRLRLDYGKQALENAVVTARKLWGFETTRRYRTVIVRDGMHSDEDASYLASPIDIRPLLEQRGCRLIRYQRDSRTPLGRALKLFFGSFAPSIWIVALKEPVKRPS